MIPEPEAHSDRPDRGSWYRWTGPALTTIVFTIALVGLAQARSAATRAASIPSAPDTLAKASAPSATSVTVPGQSPVMRATASPEVAALRQDLRAVLPSWQSAQWSILVVWK